MLVDFCNSHSLKVFCPTRNRNQITPDRIKFTFHETCDWLSCLDINEFDFKIRRRKVFDLRPFGLNDELLLKFNCATAMVTAVSSSLGVFFSFTLYVVILLFDKATTLVYSHSRLSHQKQHILIAA